MYAHIKIYLISLSQGRNFLILREAFQQVSAKKFTQSSVQTCTSEMAMEIERA